MLDYRIASLINRFDTPIGISSPSDKSDDPNAAGLRVQWLYPIPKVATFEALRFLWFDDINVEVLDDEDDGPRNREALIGLFQAMEFGPRMAGTTIDVNVHDEPLDDLPDQGEWRITSIEYTPDDRTFHLAHYGVRADGKPERYVLSGVRGIFHVLASPTEFYTVSYTDDGDHVLGATYRLSTCITAYQPLAQPVKSFCEIGNEHTLPVQQKVSLYKLYDELAQEELKSIGVMQLYDAKTHAKTVQTCGLHDLCCRYLLETHRAQFDLEQFLDWLPGEYILAVAATY